MPADVVLGLQWGDEGKGKVVDELAARCAAVVRYQGGPNAGHTLVVDGRRVALHQVPSGALHDGVTCVIAAGCVVDPQGLREELEALGAVGAHGLGPERLAVSPRAQVILPWMRDVDGAEERLRGAQAVGTTLRGVGPAYMAKAGRWGMTVGAFVDARARAERLETILPWTQRWLASVGLPAPDITALAPLAEWLQPFVADDLAAVVRARTRGRVLFEGQLGLMRDPDRGAYPFATGASILPPLGLVGDGARVIGVAKPYVTAVGAGPFPTEAPEAEAAALRESGGEFGATTGRPRRCGWLDLPALRYAVLATGATALAVTKLDISATQGALPVCTRYEGWDERQGYPLSSDMARVRPVYETWDAREPLALARRMAEAAGLPLAFTGTGPGRGEGTWVG